MLFDAVLGCMRSAGYLPSGLAAERQHGLDLGSQACDGADLLYDQVPTTRSDKPKQGKVGCWGQFAALF